MGENTDHLMKVNFFSMVCSQEHLPCWSSQEQTNNSQKNVLECELFCRKYSSIFQWIRLLMVLRFGSGQWWS